MHDQGIEGTLTSSKTKKSVDLKVEVKVQEESQVIVHCSYTATNFFERIRIWNRSRSQAEALARSEGATIQAPLPRQILDPQRVQRIGRFEVIRFIAEGGMGWVFESATPRIRTREWH